ncbi:hypothetical protein Hanom_Chr16g01451791 [Helianthus anomalus]
MRKYVSVPNVVHLVVSSRRLKGRGQSSKPSTRRSSHRLKCRGQSSDVEHVDLSDEIEFSEDQGTEVEGKKELAVIAGKKGKSSGKKVVVSTAGGS